MNLKDKQVLRKLRKIKGTLESIDFYKVRDHYTIAPHVDYKPLFGPGLGIAPTTFTRKPQLEEFISVLKTAYDAAVHNYRSIKWK